MINIDEIIAKLKENVEFETIAPLDVSTLEARVDVREMCAADRCNHYNRNWTCPPQCGDLETCDKRMKEYTHGVLLQSVGTLEDASDWEGMMELSQEHGERFMEALELLKPEYPDALFLGSGGCRTCRKCAFPEPCRFPEKAISSMEAYGLFVTDICKKNNVQYYYGAGTLTYTACILLK